MTINREGISIGTISGGIVNFGGAIWIAPITITSTTSGSGSDNSTPRLSSNTQRTITNIFELIKGMDKNN
ncbi:hypothetical protein KW850_14795 [Bacillus sp. sid0103]|uniref:spore germination protein n=1 Tax=Bacillus sp. sid0103 TaxID=2856337 RepID=UPI001C4375E7|nr:hypothetical protein [Bacillus sp. sid0103]MBV7506530.1 hypothetical protein [Bacillus sp. sid0103]